MSASKTIHPELLPAYTMGGVVPIEYHYQDDITEGPTRYTSAALDTAILRVRRRENGRYGKVDQWLYAALADYPIDGATVGIVGSCDQGFGPWYEAVVIAHGGRPVVMDYRPIEYGDDRAIFWKVREIPTVDVVLSISSIEHAGLGRYGDKLAPNADIDAMEAIRCLVPDGLMFLAVPLGLDRVVFNLHRTYGRKRLPLLLEGWTKIGAYGLDESLIDRDTGMGWNPDNDPPEYSPVLVLKNEPMGVRR